MMNPQRRLERVEEAMKVPPAAEDRFYFPAHWTKADKLASTVLMLHKAPDRDPAHTDEDLEAIALQIVESGKYDAPPAPEDAGEPG